MTVPHEFTPSSIADASADETIPYAAFLGSGELTEGLRFPGCGRPARSCDLDHIVPYPTGATDVANLQALCRYHHRIKTHTGWRVERGPNNTTIWISPRGKRYTSRPDDP